MADRFQYFGTNKLMKLSNLLSAIVLSLSIAVIAVLSVQNYTGISLQFSLFEAVTFRSLELPVGVMLAFCFCIGAISAAILPLLWQEGQKPRKNRQKNRKYSQKRQSYQKTPDPLEDW